MTITITIKRPTIKSIVLQWDVDDASYYDLRALWNIEQAFNALPGCPFKIHIDINRSENK